MPDICAIYPDKGESVSLNEHTPCQLPNDLTEAEYHELAVLSAIHPAIIAASFLHISGEEVYSYLFSLNVPRKNAGRVTDGFLRQYQHAELGGLWISGLDPLNNWQPMEWGRFKPSVPRIDPSKGKPVKYESPPKTPNRVTYFDIPDCIWDLVASRYNIKRYHSSLALRLQDKYPLESWGEGEWETRGIGENLTFSHKSNQENFLGKPNPPSLSLSPVFWEWVQKHPEIPIILCEGEKKAACLLSLGFVAIALPGIWNGRVGKKDFDERLHPDLLPMAQPGREFIILFDYEEKPRTRWNVFQATLRTGRAIEAAGSVCKVAQLPGMEKGVDDFVVARNEVYRADIFQAQKSQAQKKDSDRYWLDQNNSQYPFGEASYAIRGSQLTANCTDTPGKVEDGNTLLTAIIDDAKNLADYRNSFFQKQRGLSRKYNADITVNVKYLTQVLGFENLDGEFLEFVDFEEAWEGKSGQFPQRPRDKNAPDFPNSQYPRDKNAPGSPNSQYPRDKNAPGSPNSQYPRDKNAPDSPNHEPHSRKHQDKHRRRHKPGETAPENRQDGALRSKNKLLIPQSGLVALWSDMGTAKTEFMRQWRLQNPDVKFLNNGHRVNLLKNLANRLQTAIYSELKQGDLTKVAALSITIDSLHKLNTQYLTYGCVFIDEACQYLTHLLFSSTCKEYRRDILEVLEYVVYNAKLVVIADAHMDDITLDFFRAMRPEGEVPFIVKNNWKNGDRNVYWYEGNNPSAIVAKISAAIMAGKKIMVVSDSKNFVKKCEKLFNKQGISLGEVVSNENSATTKVQDSQKLNCDESTGEINNNLLPNENTAKTRNLDTHQNNHDKLRESINNNLSDNKSIGETKNNSPLTSELISENSELPANLRVWSIHSDNSGSKENIAFIKDITNEVKNVDVLLASPSLGTGVDIPEYHFDEVFGVFLGASQTATECCQQLYRYRPNVPIHVWVAPRPPFGYKETNPTKIREDLLAKNSLSAFLMKIERETGKRGVEKEWAFDAYCKLQAARNQSLNNLRADLRDLLTDMGNKIIPVCEEDSIEEMKKLIEAGRKLDEAHYAAVAGAEDITLQQYRTLKARDYLQPQQVFQCEKFRIKDAYGVKEVTPELVKKDHNGVLIKAIAALEGLLADSEGTILEPLTGKQYPVPPSIVTERDHQERSRLPLCFDWKNHSVTWLTRHILGLTSILRRLVNGEEITAADPELVRMYEISLKCASQIKSILGFTIHEKCGGPKWLLSTLLEQLGLKVSSSKQGARGKQVLHFSLAEEEWEFASQVIKHRQNKRALKEERTRQAAEEAARNQAGKYNQYGIDPPPDLVSTPPPNAIGKPPLGGVDTTENNGVDSAKNSRIDSSKGNNSSNPSGNSPSIDEIGGDLEPHDGDSTPIQTSLQMLRDAIVGGVEAVKATISRWSCDRRWCAVLLLEEVAATELRRLEQMIPGFYACLS
ncbi:DUF3854 domain-containing protein [Calothrix sp. PCC 6303]|uniref:DUF3854 domain-containing protein n=1 Tax=Calothrix sp. PCC 6303 TaxID=1170562 RepID=UPI0002A032C0|nr:DUF3854 domain-containing protein [Calothrix sp. PCC 6303]AFZ04633.1 hypothetical protein Cal6303_5770 [Calothrix sp. PCC 6303]